MEKKDILNIVLCILILFDIHKSVQLVARVKRAGKGNWKFRVSWKDAVGSGIKILFWLACMLYFTYKMYDLFHEYIGIEYWLPVIVFVIVEITDFIDSCIKTEKAVEKNP